MKKINKNKIKHKINRNNSRRSSSKTIKISLKKIDKLNDFKRTEN